MATTGVDTGAAGAALPAQAVTPGTPVVLPDAGLMVSARYERDGPDLILHDDAGPVLRLVGYFSAGTVDLTAPNGAMLSAATVARLAGPEAPGQYAQAGGVQTPTPSVALIGQVESLAGTAFVQRSDGTVDELSVGEKVYLNDVIWTEAASVCALVFTDGTVFTMNENARMILDELVYDAGAESGNSATFNLVEGGFVFIAGQVARTGGMDIQTPAATMGIRGTTGIVEIELVDGIYRVSVTLERDPDGAVGEIELFDLSGNMVARLTGTETTWEVSTAEGSREIARSAADAAETAVILADAVTAYTSALGRAATGESIVPMGGSRNVDPDPSDDESGATQETFDTGAGAPLGADIAPPPPAETGAGAAGDAIGVAPQEAGPDRDDAPAALRTLPAPGQTAPEPEPLPEPSPPRPEPVPDPDPVQPPPEARDAAIEIDEDDSFSGFLLRGDAAAEDLSFDLIEAPRNGAVSLRADGAYSYVPDPDFAGQDSFAYRVSNGPRDATAIVTVTVRPVNDAPVARIPEVTVAEDGSVSGTLTATDADGDPLTYALLDGAAAGEVTVAPDGAWSFTPRADRFGEDAFRVAVNDGTQTVIVEVPVTVTPVNDAPVAAPAAATGAEDGAIAVAVETGDVDGDALTIGFLQDATHGTVALVKGQLVYTPDADFFGTDAFTYTVSDGDLTTEATASVTVTPVNDAPVAAPAAVTGAEDGAIAVAVETGDVDGNALTIGFLQDAAHGTVALVEGQLVYTPDADFFGDDAFTYTVSDGDLVTQATASVTVTPVNDAPLAAPATATGAEDRAIAVAVETGDVDGDALTIGFLQDATHGTVALVEGQLVYTPDADFFGTDAFTYTVSDGDLVTQATASVTVTPVNDAPVADAVTVRVDAEGIASGRVVATDPDAGERGSFALGATGPRNGTVDVAPDGGFAYTPEEDFAGFDSFEVTVTDATGATSAATVGVVVGPRGETGGGPPGPGDADIGLDPEGSDRAPAGSIGVVLPPPEAQLVNLVVLLDRSGSVGPVGWETLKQTAADALTDTADPGLQSLRERFAGSTTQIDVQVVTYSTSATPLGDGDGPATFRLDSDAEALRAAILAAPYVRRDALTTDYDEALRTATGLLDAANSGTNSKGDENADAEPSNFVYFATDGAPTGPQDWPAALAELRDTDARGYNVTIEAFGIGTEPDFAILDEIDSGAATEVAGPADLADAFGATPLFSPELLSFSLRLIADGVDRGVIASRVEDASAFVTDQIGVTLPLAAIDGLAPLLGRSNLFFAEAVLDLDGDPANGLGEVTLRSADTLGLGAEPVDRSGTEGADVIFGSAGADSLSGGGGDDVLLAGAGRDTLDGGAGDDTLMAGQVQAGERFDGGTGRDMLALQAPAASGDLLPSLDLAGIEAIDLANGREDALALSAETIAALSEEADTDLEALLDRALAESLTVTGEAGDAVRLAAPGQGGSVALTETATDAGGTTYAVYSFRDGADGLLATLAVAQEVEVILPPAS